MLDKYLHNVIDVKKFLQNNAPKISENPKKNNNSNISEKEDGGLGGRNDASKVTTTETIKDALNGPELALFDFEANLRKTDLRRYVFAKLKVLREED